MTFLIIGLNSTVLFSQQTQYNFIIGTGSQGGNYYKTGKYIAEQYNYYLPEFNFLIIKTNGSNENIELLKDNKIDFAIVQRNIILKSIYNEEQSFENLEVIMPLYQEKFLIYSSFNKNINIRKLDSISTVKRLKLGITGKTGYSYSLYKTLLKFLNLDFDNIEVTENNYNQLTNDLINGNIDLLISFSLPIRELENIPGINKVFLSYADAKLIENKIKVIHTTLLSDKAGQYSLGTWCFLVGSKNNIGIIDSSQILSTALLNKNIDPSNIYYHNLIKETYNKFIKNKNNEYFQLKNLPLSDFLNEKIGIKANNLMPYLMIFLLLFTISFIYYLKKGRWFPEINFLYYWRRHNHFYFGFFILIFLYFSSTELLLYSEREFYLDIGIKSPLLNLSHKDFYYWLFITTITGNNNGIFPLSILGKVMLALNSLYFWIGTVFIGVSEYVSYKINRKRKNGIMETKFNNHLVIFGWNSSTGIFVKEILSDAKQYNDTNLKIVCVVPDIKYVRNEYPDIKELQDIKKIDIIQGNALDRYILELANVEKAETIILLSDDNTRISDERTVMRAHAISRYTKKKRNAGKSSKKSVIDNVKNKFKSVTLNDNKNISSYKKYKIGANTDNIYIIAEINYDDYRESLYDADVNEIVVAGNYRKAIMKQSLFNHGVSKVLDEIMQYNEYNEFYKIDLSLPEHHFLQNKTFDELVVILRKAGILLVGIHIVFHDENNNIIIDKNIIKQLLEEEEDGIIRDVIINPVDEKERYRKVDEDDHLIVLSVSKNEMERGLEKLRKDAEKQETRN
ncbi:MAG: ABC transporter substrate-binding protein [Bacteroidales bacterium]|nr:ABC transporter substrate-binding protein [Bacteroidales bacterium]